MEYDEWILFSHYSTSILDNIHCKAAKELTYQDSQAGKTVSSILQTL